MPQKRLSRAQRRRHREAVDWILRTQEGGLTDAEKADFQDWLDRDPQNRHVYGQAERVMGSEARMAIESDPALRDFDYHPPNRTKPAAASLLAIVVAGSLFFLFDGPIRLQADRIAGTGEMPVITLSDGSTVHLNASSAIAHDYTDGRRTVRLLRGQAYFEVAPDPNRPFTVEAGEISVTALGTAFDVRRGSTETDVTVTQHAVRVEFAGDGQEPLRVEEGERAAYDHVTHASAVGEADMTLALAWRRGELVLDNAPLSYVVEEMSRHFSGRIVVASDELARRRVSGMMAVSDTDAALRFLENALGVRTNRVGPVIVIRN